MNFSNFSQDELSNNTTNKVILGYNVSFEHIIYSSEIEKTLTLTFIIIVTILGMSGSLVIIAAIITSPLLHNTHFSIVGTFCSMDFINLLLSIVFYSWQILEKKQPSHLLCGLISAFRIGISFGKVSTTSLIAVERYIFFCQPYLYTNNRLINQWSIGITLSLCYLCPISYFVIFFMSNAYDYHGTVLLCRMRHFRYDMIPAGFVLTPSVPILIYCSVKTWRLIKASQVSPGEINNDPSSTAPATGIPVQQIKRGLRLICLMSGTFCLVFVPIPLCQFIIIVCVGYRWEDMDTRIYPRTALVVRSSALWFLFGSILDHISILYSRKDLRDAIKKLIWRRPNRLDIAP